jgi:hypothetical protein
MPNAVVPSTGEGSSGSPALAWGATSPLASEAAAAMNQLAQLAIQLATHLRRRGSLQLERGFDMV